MKFSEMPYRRIEKDALERQMKEVIARVPQARSAEDLYTDVQAMDGLEKELQQMSTLASIRHTMDTRDPFYKTENDYYDQILPELQEDSVAFFKALQQSPYYEQLKTKIPETWFTLQEMEQQTFSPEIIEDLQEENRLASKYQEIIGQGSVQLDGKTYTLPGLEAKMTGSDREMRKRTNQAYWQWFSQHEEELGHLYAQLVQIRTKIAHKLGFANYIPLAYLRMQRMDYGPDDVKKYREQIIKTVVPLNNMLYEKQRERLGLDKLQLWDEKTSFAQGNPMPVYDEKELVKRASQMYHELDPETGAFFERMEQDELMDLPSRPGKAPGGYCTFIPGEDVPFIFANFNGTNEDVETLTHEAGHAFQAWTSRHLFPEAVIWPTMESCEIHSMAMEFFTWPWMEQFFEDKADDFRLQHLEGAFKFLPYGALVDHFQHEVYANPDMTNAQRMAVWRKLEKQYLPHKNYEGCDFLERGGWWMRQLHIFMDPFYYIDYTLAQAAALQFWARMVRSDQQAFEDYKHICRLGGTLPFTKILEAAHLQVPFEEGSLDSLSETAAEWFKSAEV